LGRTGLWSPDRHAGALWLAMASCWQGKEIFGQIPASRGQVSREWWGMAARRGRGCGSTLSSEGVRLTQSSSLLLLPLKMGGSSSGWI